MRKRKCLKRRSSRVFSISTKPLCFGDEGERQRGKPPLTDTLLYLSLGRIATAAGYWGIWVLELLQVVPLGDLPAWVVADLAPVRDARRRRALAAQHHAAHHLVFGGAVEVDDQELHRQVRHELGGHVVDE